MDTSEIEEVVFPSWCCAALQSWVDIQKKKESTRVPKDSPLACARCGKYRAYRCSLRPEQVCGWCHRPDVDHHGAKVRRRHVPSKTYVMTDIETGALIPHPSPAEEGDDSCYVYEPLPGPCLSCGYDGHVCRLLYQDPDQGAPFQRGVANQALCYARGAGKGNREPVHPEEVPAEETACLPEEKHDQSIKIVPPIMGTKEAPNPQYVDLNMKVEPYHGHDEDDATLSEADRI